MSQGFGNLFGGNSWIWILLILVFVLPSFHSGCGTGGLFGGGSSWILIILLLIFILPSLGIGGSHGGLGSCLGDLGNIFGCGC
ncbi:MAG: hypothetical protein K0Q99_1347 [Clostridia bacterium]|jgi:hypothetical protein|nr:hypothetical protein [Clostridia bacterium]